MSIAATTKYMPVAKYSLTLVHKGGENALEVKERALYYCLATKTSFFSNLLFFKILQHVKLISV